jgi:hypothetical protein
MTNKGEKERVRSFFSLIFYTIFGEVFKTTKKKVEIFFGSKKIGDARLICRLKVLVAGSTSKVLSCDRQVM